MSFPIDPVQPNPGFVANLAQRLDGRRVPLLNGEFFENDVERHHGPFPARVADGTHAEELVDASSEILVPFATVTERPFLAVGNHGPVTTSDTYTATLCNTRLANGNGTHYGATVGRRNETASILRAARLRDLLASIEEFWRASGPDRTYWRRDARHRLAEWRRLYRIPERAAFQAAVSRTAQRRA